MIGIDQALMETIFIIQLPFPETFWMLFKMLFWYLTNDLRPCAKPLTQVRQSKQLPTLVWGPIAVLVCSASAQKKALLRCALVACANTGVSIAHNRVACFLHYSHVATCSYSSFLVYNPSVHPQHAYVPEVDSRHSMSSAAILQQYQSHNCKAYACSMLK